jgi:hypothetical protein
MGVGLPQQYRLIEFGEYVQDAFGEVAYHVGSSLERKDGWRDVDVRVMLPDGQWDALGFGDPVRVHINPRWVAMVVAWSEFGKALTGLPIDFQIQKLSHSNDRETGQRSALVRFLPPRQGVDG